MFDNNIQGGVIVGGWVAITVAIYVVRSVFQLIFMLVITNTTGRAEKNLYYYLRMFSLVLLGLAAYPSMLYAHYALTKYYL